MTESEKLSIVKNLENYISKNLVKENLFDKSSNAIFEFELGKRESDCKTNFESTNVHNLFKNERNGIGINQAFKKSSNFDNLFESALDSIQSKIINLFSNTELTFQERLFEIIRERKIDEVELYTKAQITKQTFSKIRSNRDYKPTKNTAFLLVLALNLNLEEAENLLSRAGIAFSPSDKLDLAIKFFIENKIYDIFEINEILLQSGIKTLAG